MASAYVLEKFQRKCHIFKVCVPPYLIESHLKSFGAMSPWSLSIKSFGFVLGYNHAVGAVRIYHIKKSMHKKKKKKRAVAQRGFGTLETLESISLITPICALGLCDLA